MTEPVPAPPTPPTPPPPPAPAPAPAAPPPPRRRWKKILAWTGGLLALLLAGVVFAAPPIVSSIARPRIVAAINDSIDGTATIDAFSFSWFGATTVDGLAVRDAKGELVLSVKHVDVYPSILAALGGRYVADVVVTEPVIAARRDASGAVNVQSLAKPPPAAAGAPPSPSKLPYVKAKVRVSRGRLAVDDAVAGRIEFTDVAATIDVDSLDNPVRFDATLSGPGTIKAEGEVTIARTGMLALDRASGRANVTVTDFPVASVRGFAPLRELDGRLRGRASVTFAGRSGSATTDFELTDAVAAYGDLAPLRVRRLQTDGTFALDDAGAGTHKLTLTLDSAVRAEVVAKTKGLSEVAGTATIAADVKGVADTAGELLQLKRGYALAGKATATAEFAVDLATRRIYATIDARLADFAATDEAGRALPVDPTASLAAKFEADPAGMLRVEYGELKTGSITATLRGGADLNARTFSDSLLKLDADLDDLSRKLASFVDLGFSFGGKVRIDGTLQGAGETARASGTATVSQLRLTGWRGRNAGPLDVRAALAASADLRAGGRSTVERLEIRSELFDLDARGEAGDVTDPGRIAGSGSYTLKAAPAAIQAKLGDFLAGYSLSGTDISATGEFSFRGREATVRGKVKAGELHVAGPALRSPQGDPAHRPSAKEGANAADLRALAVTHDVTADAQTLHFDARDVTITCDEARASGVAAQAITLKLAASCKGEDVAVTRFELASSVAGGSGSASVKGIRTESPSAAGKFDLRGDAATLLAIARPFQPALADVTAAGTWEAELRIASGAQNVKLTSHVHVRGLTVEGTWAGGRPFWLRNADFTINSVVDVIGLGDGSAELVSAAVRGPGFELTASGTVAGFLANPRRYGGGFRVDATWEPDGTFFDYRLSGDPLRAGVELGFTSDRYTAKGDVKAPRIELAGASTLAQRDVAVDFDVVYDKDLVDVRACRYRSATATASVAGRVAGSTKMSADLRVVADAELAQVVKDLGLKDYDVRGRANVTLDVKGDAGQLKATGGGTIANFELRQPDGKSVADPKIEFTSDADVATERLDVTLNEAGLKAAFARGTLRGRILNLRGEPEFRGLKGDLVYLPEPLGAVLKPWLSGTLAGAEERKVTFALDGRAKDLSLLAVLRGSTGTGALGIAQYTTPMFGLAGDMTWDLKDQRMKSTTGLDLNRGKASIVADLDLREAATAVSTTRVELKDVEANTAMSGVLCYVHPVFAVLEGRADAAIAGKVDFSLDASYRAALKLEEFTEWARVPKPPINGKGRFAIRDLKLAGTALVADLLKAIAADALEDLTIDPIEFTIANGRLSYDKPIPMRISKNMTHWTGTIGLDQTLDMAWEIPVTEKLLAKYPYLKYWKVIRVPLGGTVTSPKLRWDDMLADLARQAAQKAIDEKKDDVLDDVLGSRNEKAAKELFEKAEKLYAEGKKAEAAPLYKKIKDDYDKTRTYRDNKDRIKQRMTGQ